MGRVDLVVNTVGVSTTHGPLLETDHDGFMAGMARNTWPIVELAQAAVANGMGEGGALVAVSTIGSHSIQPLLAPYCASKAALEVLVRHLARELGPRGIRVNAVAPGLVQTNMSRALWEGEQAGRRRRSCSPSGGSGARRTSRRRSSGCSPTGAAWTTGQVIDVDGGRTLVGDEPASCWASTSGRRRGEGRCTEP